MAQLALIEDAPRPPVTSVRRRRDVYYFDSMDAAYSWGWRNMPKYPPGAVCVCPPRAKREGGGYVLRYTVTFPGHVRYYTLCKNLHLMEE